MRTKTRTSTLVSLVALASWIRQDDIAVCDLTSAHTHKLEPDLHNSSSSNNLRDSFASLLAHEQRATATQFEANREEIVESVGSVNELEWPRACHCC